MPDITIAVDGFSATGKSTFAKLVAKDFGFLYLDSGAMYRAVTLFAQENGMIDADSNIDLDALKAALDKGLDIHFEHTEDGCKTFIGERCVEKDIRTMAVSNQVSPVSAVGFVRNFVDDKLHAFSAAGRVIMDGRDIGTTVFPNAEVKIFMTARPEVRAQRRFDELVMKGENPVMEEVVKNLEERDYIDSHREVSPLSRAADAFVMDNSDMTLHEETVWMLGLLQGKFGILE
ncbi:MAG: (d)CMP kinase [Bacteroidales bacterium]|nr:(d)CMP kinase [Bacteroidales bacterium]MBR4818257.1 (d)CMP kinase [Bacteroidales bacterium]